METEDSTPGISAQRLILGVLLLIIIGGFLTLQFFWVRLLRPGQLDVFSLPLVALVAGIAATFNPCALPVLPGFLISMGAADTKARRRAGLSLAASLGAMSVVLVIGVLVALVGEGTKDLITPNFRWVQLVVGVFLIVVAILHLLGKTDEFPFVGPIMALGSDMWDRTMNEQTPRTSYLFGAGFVLVGVG